MQIGAPAANLNGRAPPGLPLQSQVLPSVSAMLTDPLKDAIRAALGQPGIAATEVWELDERQDGGEVQAALGFTGATTVPRVFVGG